MPKRKIPAITTDSPKITNVFFPQNDIIFPITNEVIKATKDSTEIMIPIFMKFKLYFSEA